MNFQILFYIIETKQKYMDYRVILMDYILRDM